MKCIENRFYRNVHHFKTVDVLQEELWSNVSTSYLMEIVEAAQYWILFKVFDQLMNCLYVV